tara:strand:+ start:3044 stop:4012 length:969 start_codon:yes stop_codon:yes gene_type:complete
MLFLLFLFVNIFGSDYQVFSHGNYRIHWIDLGLRYDQLNVHINQNKGMTLSKISSNQPHDIIINGSFYVSEGDSYRPLYYLQVDKVPLSQSSSAHGAFGWSDSDLIWGVISPTIWAHDQNGKWRVRSLNWFGPKPRLWTYNQPPHGVKYCFQSQMLGGESRCHHPVKKLSVIFNPADQNEEQWKNIKHVIMGVPLLIKNGKMVMSKRQSEFYRFPLARTVIAQTKDRHLILVVVENNTFGETWWRLNGHWPFGVYPKGMSLAKLTSWLISKGIVNALNLDGGGSTGLAIDGKVIVQPRADVDDPVSFIGGRSISHFLIFSHK